MFMNSRSSVVMFLMGAAVGAAAAACYTDGGKLRRRFTRVAEHAADVADDAISQADGFVQDTARSARSLAKRASNAFQRERAVVEG